MQNLNYFQPLMPPPEAEVASFLRFGFFHKFFIKLWEAKLIKKTVLVKKIG